MKSQKNIIMKKIILLLVMSIFIFSSCQKSADKKKAVKSKEELIMDFCKLDVQVSCISPSTIKYDTLMSDFYKVEKNFNYYRKEFSEINGIEQTIDSTSEKWQGTIYFDSQNEYGANLRNEITYIVKENPDYLKDTLMNFKFVILSKRDKNKVNEYFAAVK
jgi:hypothetical protein